MIGAAGFAGIDWVARADQPRLLARRGAPGPRPHDARGRALVDHAFGELELHRVEIQAAGANRRSRAIPERLGFQQEGILREAECVGGRYLDLGRLRPAGPR